MIGDLGSQVTLELLAVPLNGGFALVGVRVSRLWVWRFLLYVYRYEVHRVSATGGD